MPSAKTSPAPKKRAPKPAVLAISNQKGGEGKTTTAVNLAASLAAAEHRVLLVDLDPQGNASSSVGYPRGMAKQGSYDLLLGQAELDAVVHPTELPTLGVVPASPDLAGAEIELVGVDARESVLARAFRRARAGNNFDWEFVILDCPPSLGILTLNALVAASSVLIPMQAKYFSLEGLGALVGTIERVKAALNPSLSLEGIVFCMFDRRTNLAQQVVAEVQSHFPGQVFETMIPQNIRLSESPSFGKPALLYDIESKGAQAYLALAKEMLARRQAGRS
ncbi:Chromosome partitioning protein ParA [Enhygromyxa salina]|uniref:Chromosome partitioning protein ParA n=1 Tax=Enhygromyxa salina TaxID=215803 RepID=A0A2S9XXM7_9BACT|nr:ParA family protein [Enhygromyxa salina]PRP97627.1 Chromosome partitioning protein ParA [Enhygromyxa salina]